MSFPPSNPILVLFLFLLKIDAIFAHGRLYSPPSRSSMWRQGYNTPTNYNDHELNCGGYTNQWILNFGKCGICGDPYNGVRENEAGGKYATGQIVSEYVKGQDIMAVVQLTANHGGYFEFNLCPVNRSDVKATLRCMEKHPVFLTNGQKKYHLSSPKTNGNFSIPLRLPTTLTCSQCVFRWKYVTASNNNCIKNGTCGRGVGPQEEFYGCADIRIKSLPKRPPTTPSVNQGGTGSPQGTTCRSKLPWRNNPLANSWCKSHCARGLCNRVYCEEACF